MRSTELSWVEDDHGGRPNGYGAGLSQLVSAEVHEVILSNSILQMSYKYIVLVLSVYFIAL